MIPFLAAVVILAAVVFIIRRNDVRLVLTLGALLLGLLGQQVGAVTSKFLATLSDEKFVIPICTAMGFAYVLRQTQCDQHLVQLLVRPLRSVRMLLIPGTVLVGFITNIPIVSQSGTAATIGPVLIPLLTAAKISPVTAGASLLLGSSMGGELFNPGAPELQTVSNTLTARWHKEQERATAENREPDPWERRVAPTEVVYRAAPFALLALAVVVPLFWWRSSRHERLEIELAEPAARDDEPAESGPFRINYLKAFIPVVPLILLFLAGKPLEWLHIDRAYLLTVGEPDRLAATRLVGAAMLVGVALAMATSIGTAGASVRAFFEGAGFAYTNVISLIVAATAFGAGAKVVGLDTALEHLVDWVPALLVPLAIGATALFAWVCGSGFAATQSLYPFYVDPARDLGVDPVGLGAVASLASAMGRTMSPVAAVVFICSTLTNTQPLDLVRRVAGPLLIGLIVVTAARMLFPAW